MLPIKTYPLTILICALLLACGWHMRSKVHNVSSTILEDKSSESVAMNSDFTARTSLRKLGEFRLTSRENLILVNFQDATTGWVASSGRSLYKTDNGGQVWQQVYLDAPLSSNISSMSFINHSLGWVAATRYASDPLRTVDNKGFVLRTSDGGKSWHLQFSSDSIQLYVVHFINEQEGWAGGRRRLNKNTVQDELFVLHTTDGGSNWTDVSGELNRLIANGKGEVQDFVSDIYSVEPGKLLILTVRGRIFSTTDSGQIWQKVTAVTDEPMQTFIGRLGFTSDSKLWVLGGADSREGMWGMLAQRGPDNSWTVHRTEARLSDAVYLSPVQVLACGSMKPLSGNQFNERRNGVLLYSTDSGFNWTVVYRNKDLGSINALSITEANHIWAVGNDGLVLHFGPS